ncbi:ABC transporter permease [Streptomyces olivaceus]
MLKTALRNVLAHKARLLMTVLAVLLGTAFVAGTLVFTSTLSSAYEKSAVRGAQDIDVAVRLEEDSQNAAGKAVLTASTVQRLSELPGVRNANGTVTGDTALADKKGDLVGDGWSSKGGNWAEGDPRYPMEKGRGPLKGGEVALDSHTAERTGYRVGDTVRLSVAGPVRTEKVTGIFRTDDGGVAAGGSLVLFDTASAQRLFAEPGRWTGIELRAEEGVSQTALAARAEKALPTGAEAVTGKRLAKEQADSARGQMDTMRTGLLAFAGIALFVGIFLIANTFSMLVAQRTAELALMRALGASRRQVTRSVLIEALAVGLIASAGGLAAGIAIGAGLRSLLNASGQTIPDGPLVISPSTVLISLLTGVVVTVYAARMPARRAAKTPPVAAMNSVHAEAGGRSLLWRNSLGALLTAAGAVGVLAAISSKNKPLMGGGAALLVIGVFVLTPLLSRPVIAAAAPLLHPFGISGKLARRNAVRAPRRTAATASALMIGLTLVTGLTVVAGSVAQAIDKMAADSVKADYTVSMTNLRPLSPEVERTLAEQPGVTATSPLQIAAAKSGDKELRLTGVDADQIAQLAAPEFVDGSWRGFGGDKVAVDKATAEKNNWKQGSTVPVRYEDGRSDKLTVSAVYEDNAMFSGVMLDSAVLAPHLRGATDQQVLVAVDGGPSDAARERLEDALGNNPAVAVKNKEDVSDDFSSAFNLLLNMVYGLLGMAVLVAVLGVVNTLAMSVYERQQELGVLRAIGLDRRRVKRMVRLESVTISLFGGVMGVALGVFFGWAVGQLIGDSLSTYELVLPWPRLILFLFLAGVVGVLAALWPARRAARLNVLQAIKAQ